MGSLFWQLVIERFSPSEFRTFSLRSGQQFVLPPEFGDSVILVKTGGIKFFALNSKGREYICSFHESGEVALAWGHETYLKAEAMVQSEVICVPLGRVEALAGTDPEIGKDWINILQKLIRIKSRREYELLVLNASERFQRHLKEPKSEWRKGLPQSQISAYLGITPSALVRLLKTGFTSYKFREMSAREKVNSSPS